MSKPRPFAISEVVVQEAYRRVKANKGAAGVDGETIEEFDKDREGNLYKLWNRMSSGSSCATMRRERWGSGPPESPYRGRLQTTVSGVGQVLGS